MAEIKDGIWSFLAAKRRLGRMAESSEKMYRAQLEDCADYFAGVDENTITRSMISDYFADWERRFGEIYGRRPAPKTVGCRQSYVASYFRHQHALGRIDADPTVILQAPKRQRPVNDWLRGAEDEAFCREAAAGDPLEQVVCLGLRWQGFRIEELASLLDEDVNPEEGWVRVRKSKSNHGERTLPILPEWDPAVRAWRRERVLRGLDGHRAFLPTRAGRRPGSTEVTPAGTPMEPSFLWRIVKRVATRAELRLYGWEERQTRDENGRLITKRMPIAKDKAGINTTAVTPHTLRRTAGSWLLNQGVRLEVVSDFLGHANTRVTEEAYAELLQERRTQEVLAVFPGQPAGPPKLDLAEQLVKELERGDAAFLAKLRALLDAA